MRCDHSQTIHGNSWAAFSWSSHCICKSLSVCKLRRHLLPRCFAFDDHCEFKFIFRYKFCYQQYLLFQFMLASLTISLQVIWSLTLELCGRFHNDSKQTLGSWKLMNFSSGLERRLMMKYKRSCKPLVVGKEGVYTIKRLSVLKFIRGNIKATFRALLTLR